MTSQFFTLATLISFLLLALAMEAEAFAGKNLEARLQAEEAVRCWESLTELRSCTGEVILFFLNGETYLGPSCCRAIRTIEHSCWAADALMAALGFTAEEDDVLRGFCNAEESSSAPPPPQQEQIATAPPPETSKIHARTLGNFMH